MAPLHRLTAGRPFPTPLPVLGAAVVALVCAAFFPPPASAQVVTDGIAAIVNSEVIPFQEVKKQVEDTERILRETYSGTELVERVKEARLNALRALIERELIIQDFQKQGYFIPESIIEDRLRNVIQTQYEGDRTAFIRTIQANGLSLDQYKKEIRDQIIVQVMRMRNVSNNVIVSPYKIEQYYQDNVPQFTQDEQVKLRILFLRKSSELEAGKDAKGNDIQIDPAKKMAEELLFKLDTGSDFAEIARSYSEGANRTDGGDLGWVKKGDIRPEVAEAAFALKPGETSRVVATAEGYYIVRVENTKRSRVAPISEVRADIERTLSQEERQRLQQEWLDRLRAKAFIKTEF